MIPVGATPFICHGQTIIAANPTVNPLPNSVGLIGECTRLPYQVPTGKILVVTSMHIEAVYGAAMILYAAPDCSDSTKALTTLSSESDPNNIRASAQYNDLSYQLPAGSFVSVYLAATKLGWTYGWDFGGYLIDAP